MKSSGLQSGRWWILDVDTYSGQGHTHITLLTRSVSLLQRKEVIKRHPVVQPGIVNDLTSWRWWW